ncbi:MAG: hypothetical protein JJD98_10525 [Polaromonas sp.]|nr:hypothetical protein [Polaromonas sp.]
MNNTLANVRLGLLLAILTVLFGIVLGVVFGVNEEGIVNWIAQGIAAHPELHDASSPEKIWRYVQRAHMHAGGIGAFSLGLILAVALSGMRAPLKKLSSSLIGLSGFYPLSWFSTFYLSPSIGRDAAHHSAISETLTYIGVGGLLLGLFILIAHLLFDCWREQPTMTG